MLHGLFKSVTFLQRFALYLLYINQKSCTFKIFTSLIEILARNNGDGGSVSVSKCCRCQLLECRERQVNVFFGARRTLVFNRDGHTKNGLYILILNYFWRTFCPGKWLWHTSYRLERYWGCPKGSRQHLPPPTSDYWHQLLVHKRRSLCCHSRWSLRPKPTRKRRLRGRRRRRLIAFWEKVRVWIWRSWCFGECGRCFYRHLVQWFLSNKNGCSNNTWNFCG